LAFFVRKKWRILAKESSILLLYVAKLLKEQHLQKLNITINVKPICIGLFGYLCTFIFGTYAED